MKRRWGVAKHLCREYSVQVKGDSVTIQKTSKNKLAQHRKMEGASRWLHKLTNTDMYYLMVNREPLDPTEAQITITTRLITIGATRKP